MVSFHSGQPDVNGASQANPNFPTPSAPSASAIGIKGNIITDPKPPITKACKEIFDNHAKVDPQTPLDVSAQHFDPSMTEAEKKQFNEHLQNVSLESIEGKSVKLVDQAFALKSNMDEFSSGASDLLDTFGPEDCVGHKPDDIVFVRGKDEEGRDYFNEAFKDRKGPVRFRHSGGEPEVYDFSKNKPGFITRQSAERYQKAVREVLNVIHNQRVQNALAKKDNEKPENEKSPRHISDKGNVNLELKKNHQNSIANERAAERVNRQIDKDKKAEERAEITKVNQEKRKDEKNQLEATLAQEAKFKKETDKSDRKNEQNAKSVLIMTLERTNNFIKLVFKSFKGATVTSRSENLIADKSKSPMHIIR